MSADMIEAWVTDEGGLFTQTGVLGRIGANGSTFAYRPEADPSGAVSLTMPPRLQSWDWQQGLAPIFEMNLPEGALRERLSRTFAKATGRFDDLDLLAIVGRSQIGRVRYAAVGQGIDDHAPFQSVDEILRAKRSDGLFDYLLERFAANSGIAGVQPKVLIRDEGKLSSLKSRQSPSIQGATHIVKMWDPRDYPQLAANEYFCLMAARHLGFEVPPFTLSDTGDALVIERFDIGPDGWLGFEDFCILNGVNASRKYDGSVETSLFKRLSQFCAPEHQLKDAQTLFRLFVLNCALGNGDAHLKNFGLLYDRINGTPRLAPVYDLVNTTAYLPADTMALRLDGSTRWPSRARLTHLGRSKAALSSRQISDVIEATASVLMTLRSDVQAWFNASSDPDIGTKMIAHWEAWAQAMQKQIGLS